MHSLPRPQVIFTHESDLDGLVAGVLLQRLARKLFQADVPLEAFHYHAWKQHDCREQHAWVADLSFEHRMDRSGWVVFDHHITDCAPKSAQLFHDQTKSAGLICYDHCRQHGIQSPELDRLVHLNNLSDLFLDQDPDFALASDYASLVKVYQFWNLHRLLDGEIERLLNHPLLEVMATKRRVEDPIGYEWCKKNIMPISAEVGYVDTVIGNTNLLVNRLLEEKTSPFPVLLTIFRRGTTVMVASMRSRNGEALKVAERLRGGGHPNAAGAVLPRSVKGIQQAIEYLKQILNPQSRNSPPGDISSLFDAIDAELSGREQS
ncbi:MAG: DHH family phosphoesterase [Verrucomicrobia bacterium]|nr:DHH family phosphoesterase [Verrucomicrobiota bacterium]